MLFSGTGFQPWTLTTGNNDLPDVTQGRPTSFNCDTIPDRQKGGLANYLPAALATFRGTFTQPGSGASIVPWDKFLAALVDSIDWRNTDLGTVVSSDHVFGTMLSIIELYGCGFKRAARVRNAFPTTAGAHAFEYSFYVPAALGLGRLAHDTSQLALLFKDSQIVFNVADDSVIDGLSTGSTITNLTLEVSACLVPRPELVLGTGIEWILHQTVAGTNNSQIQIKGFGRTTNLEKPDPKGGVVWLGAMTSLNSQGGSFLAQDITQYSFPWRGQDQTRHVQAILAQVFAGMPAGKDMNNAGGATAVAGAAGVPNDFSGYPYAMNIVDPLNTITDLNNLLFWPMVHGADELHLSQLQTADRDESVFIQGPTFSGTHQFLACYARKWSGATITDWIKRITSGTDSLADYVLSAQNQNVGNARPILKLTDGKSTISRDKATYMPIKFAVPRKSDKKM